jgi:hypothetical protein
MLQQYKLCDATKAKFLFCILAQKNFLCFKHFAVTLQRKQADQSVSNPLSSLVFCNQPIFFFNYLRPDF